MSNKFLKKLVIFYSLDGNTEYIARTIAKSTNADLLQLKPKKEKKRKGFLKYFLGGMQVALKLKPKLLPLEKNISDYDLIFIGTPVWASSYTPILNSFFYNYKINNKKVALFCCFAGSKGHCFLDIKRKLMDENTVLSVLGFKSPLLSDTAKNKTRAENWAKKIIEEIK